MATVICVASAYQRGTGVQIQSRVIAVCLACACQRNAVAEVQSLSKLVKVDQAATKFSMLAPAEVCPRSVNKFNLVDLVTPRTRTRKATLDTAGGAEDETKQ